MVFYEVISKIVTHCEFIRETMVHCGICKPVVECDFVSETVVDCEYISKRLYLVIYKNRWFNVILLFLVKS